MGFRSSVSKYVLCETLAGIRCRQSWKRLLRGSYFAGYIARRILTILDGEERLPLARSNTNTKPCLVTCATASTALPSRCTLSSTGAAGKSAVPTRRAAPPENADAWPVSALRAIRLLANKCRRGDRLRKNQMRGSRWGRRQFRAWDRGSMPIQLWRLRWFSRLPWPGVVTNSPDGAQYWNAKRNFPVRTSKARNVAGRPRVGFPDASALRSANFCRRLLDWLSKPMRVAGSRLNLRAGRCGVCRRS